MDAARLTYRLAFLIVAGFFFFAPAVSLAQESPAETPPNFPGLPGLAAPAPVVAPADGRGSPAVSPLAAPLGLPDLSRRETFSSAMQIIILLTVLSLAPAILLMMTSFTRIIIVLALLRQALGAQQLPPNQIMIGLALFMTFLVMRPTFEQVNSQALQPYMNGKIEQRAALTAALVPLRRFMQHQIDYNHDSEDVALFMEFAHEKAPKSWSDVSTLSLIPAFMLSELKTAFSMGFRVYLPFLIIDMVVSSVLISMGMMMLPPALVSLPFKLLLFVLVGGWHLITASLMGSFLT
jgi:flagellar biosynthetic protein FliP